MCQMGASDLHLCVGSPALVRKDGRIQPLDPNMPALTDDFLQRLLEPIMPAANRQEFAERHDTDFAYEIPKLARFRANVFADRKGRGAVFRVIPSEILTAEKLGLSPHILNLCKLNKGLVLVTGPTGSGKSTTLCAMIDYINRTRDEHIITIEDPIEFVHQNQKCLINQREVRTHTDSFKAALRAALREDPGHPARRRAARPRNRGDRDRDRRNRPSRVRDAAHDDGRVDGRSHHRSVPVRSAGADPHHAVGVAARRHRADAVPQDRRRARGGAGSAHRERRGQQSDSRRQDVPDSRRSCR